MTKEKKELIRKARLELYDENGYCKEPLFYKGIEITNVNIRLVNERKVTVMGEETDIINVARTFWGSIDPKKVDTFPDCKNVTEVIKKYFPEKYDNSL